MTFKRMSRLAYALPLICASMPVQAQTTAEVTLNNGTPISWIEFAKAINNPSTIKGTVDPNSDVAKRLSEANLALEQAQGEATTAGTDFVNATKAYKQAEDNLTELNNQISKINKAIGVIEEEQKGYQQNISDQNTLLTKYTTEFAGYNLELSKVPTKSNSVPYKWMQNIYDAAAAFTTDYEADVPTGTPKVWIKYGNLTAKIKNVLIISYAETAPEPEGWTQYDANELWTYAETLTISRLYIYMGAEYAALNNGETKYQVASYSKDFVNLANDALSAIVNLKGQALYQDTTTYPDPELAKPIQDKIDGVQAKIDAANAVIAENQAKIDGREASQGVEAIVGTKTRIAEKRAEITPIQNQIDAYIDIPEGKELSRQAELKNAVDAAQLTKNEKDAAVVTQERAVATAQAAYDKAVETAGANALANYKTIQLNSDVTATEAISNFDGIIIGNDHVINLGEGVTAAFNSFTGTLSNTAVNGKFASNIAGARFSNVAAWNNAGVYYNEAGVKTENIGTISQLGYMVRNQFDVNFTDQKLQAKSSAVSPVYKVTVYETPKNTTTYYVQKDATGKLVKENGVLTIAPNTFFKSETRDLAGIDNLFYNDNTCESVVITDRTTFYCPVDLLAETVKYDRTFAVGKQAVCLPFDITSDFGNGNVEWRSRFDKEDLNTFWFKKVAGTIDANTPTLIKVTQPFTMPDLYNVTIKATPASQVTTDEGDTTDLSKAHGTFKAVTGQEIEGAEFGYKIYGLTTNGTFMRAAADAPLPILRLVLSSKYSSTQGIKAPSKVGYDSPDEKSIGVLEEDGSIADDISTSVNGVTAGLSVEGAQGEIIFNSDADYNEVGVYTVAGALATVANVKVGTTSVALPAGLYIVMGQKVMVK